MSPRGPSDELWAVVTDPTRKQLLDALLAHGRATATTLAAELPMTRQAVTKQLAILDRAGLIQGERQGREVRWEVRPEGLNAATEAIAHLASQWERRIQAIKRQAEAAARGERPREDAPGSS